MDPENLWSGPRVDRRDWAEVLAGNLEELVAAWSEDEAWRGTVQVGDEMPAATLGDMAYAEILLHGWDIARACGARAGRLTADGRGAAPDRVRDGRTRPPDARLRPTR